MFGGESEHLPEEKKLKLVGSLIKNTFYEYKNWTNLKKLPNFKFQNKVNFIISTVLHSVGVLDCCIKVSKSPKQFMVSSILPKKRTKK